MHHFIPNLFSTALVSLSLSLTYSRIKLPLLQPAIASIIARRRPSCHFGRVRLTILLRQAGADFFVGFEVALLAVFVAVGDAVTFEALFEGGGGLGALGAVLGGGRGDGGGGGVSSGGGSCGGEVVGHGFGWWGVWWEIVLAGLEDRNKRSQYFSFSFSWC